MKISHKEHKVREDHKEEDQGVWFEGYACRFHDKITDKNP